MIDVDLDLREEILFLIECVSHSCEWHMKISRKIVRYIHASPHGVRVALGASFRPMVDALGDGTLDYIVGER